MATISEVLRADAPHSETHRVQNGKYARNVESGPYFGQVASIPETDLLLANNHLGAPLLPGEKIKATFYIDQSDHSIVWWSATPAPR